MASIRFTNIVEFSANFDKFAENSAMLAMQQVRKVALDILRGVLRKTPVDTGLLRGSWQVGLNRTPSGVGDANTAAAAVTASAIGTLATAKPTDTIIIVNNVEYAVYVELGTDRIAPRLMLSRSVNEALRRI